MPFPGAGHISFATDWAANFGLIDSESYQKLFPSFCAQPSEVAVLYDPNLGRRPFLRQVVGLDLLLCKGFDLEHEVFVPMSYVYIDLYATGAPAGHWTGPLKQHAGLKPDWTHHWS